MDHDLQWLAWAFTVSNTVRALFYLPQIAAVARSNDGARSIALSTWCMWAANNALGAFYAAAALADPALALSFAASLAGCTSIIALTLAKRRDQRREFLLCCNMKP